MAEASGQEPVFDLRKASIKKGPPGARGIIIDGTEDAEDGGGHGRRRSSDEPRGRRRSSDELRRSRSGYNVDPQADEAEVEGTWSGYNVREPQSEVGSSRGSVSATTSGYNIRDLRGRLAAARQRAKQRLEDVAGGQEESAALSPQTPQPIAALTPLGWAGHRSTMPAVCMAEPPGSLCEGGTADVVLNALASTPLFARCEDENDVQDPEGAARFVAELHRRAERVDLPPGEELSLKGGPMMVVETGELTVRAGSGPPAAFGPGSVLNTLGALDEVPGDGTKPEPQPGIQRSGPSPASPSSPTSAAGWRSTKSPRTPDGDEEPIMLRQQTGEEDSEQRRNITTILGNLCPHWTPPSMRRLQDALRRPPESLGKLMAKSADGEDERPTTVAIITAELLQEAAFASGFSAQLEANRDMLVGLCEVIRRRSLLPGAPPEVAWALAECAERLVVEPGTEIVSEGDSGDHAESVIIIDQGMAAVEKFVPGEEKQTAIRAFVTNLTPGAIIGDVGFVGSRVTRAATVRATTTCVVVRIPAAGIFAALTRFPGLCACIHGRLREIAMLLKPSLPVRTQVLSTLMLFSDCAAAFITTMASISERRVCFGGTLIKEEGSDEGTLHTVEFGVCRVDVKGKGMVATVHVGTCFGEQVFLGWSEKAAASVLVHSPIALLLSIRKNAFQMSLTRYPEEVRRFESRRERPGEDSRGRDAACLEVFKSCGHSFTKEMGKVIEVRYYLPGQTATVEGAADAGQMFLVKGGTATVEVGGKRVQELGIGSIFGEYAMLGLARRRAATVRATTLCVTMEIPRVGFLAALDRHPGERQHFEELATQKGDVGMRTWPIFEGMPRHLLYLVNLYAERRITLPKEWTSLGGQSLRKEAAVLVLQGAITFEGEDGVCEYADGDCINEQVLMELPPDAGELVPQTSCEVQILTQAVYEKVMELFPELRDTVARNIMRSMARKAHKSYGGGGSLAKVPVLGVSALFRNVPVGLAEKLFAKLKDGIYRPDQAITIEGAEGDKMFFFLTGSYSIQTGHDVERDAQLRCRVFGEAALVGMASHYPASVKSTGVTLVQTLSRSDFKEALQEYPEEWERFEALRLQVAGDGSYGRLKYRLKQNHFLSEAGSDFLAACCRCAEDAFFAPGETIIDRGDVLSLGHSPVYVLLCGEVEVLSEHNIHMLSLSPGEVFGEQGLREEKSFHETALRNWKVGLSHCARLRADALASAVRNFPACRDALEASLKHREAAAADFRERRRVWLQQTVAPALASSWVFAGFPREAVERIATPLDAARVPAGQNIVEAGQPADFMILLLRGDADVLSKSGLVIGSICGGAMIGEASMLGLLAFRTSTVHAVTECHVMAVPNKVVQDVLASPGLEGTTPRGRPAADVFRSLYETRRGQIAEGLPMSALPVVLGDGWTNEASSFARAIALQAEHLHVAPGRVWYPIPDDCPRGPHFGVLVGGQAKLVMGRDGEARLVMALMPGELVAEGLAAKYGAHISAVTACDAYRIWQSDVLSVVKSMPTAQKFWTRFEALWKPAQEKSRHRLECACGVTKKAMRTHQELAAWKEDRDQRVREAEMMRRERRLYDLDYRFPCEGAPAAPAAASPRSTLGSAREMLALAPASDGRRRRPASSPALLRPRKSGSLPGLTPGVAAEAQEVVVHTHVHACVQRGGELQKSVYTSVRNVLARYPEADTTVRVLAAERLRPLRAPRSRPVSAAATAGDALGKRVIYVAEAAGPRHGSPAAAQRHAGRPGSAPCLARARGGPRARRC